MTSERRVGVDLVGEVGQATRRWRIRTTVLPSPRGTLHATDRRRLHLLELLRFARLDLRPRTGTTATATEGTLGAATTTGATAETAAATGTTAEAAAATGAATGTAAPAAPGRRATTRAGRSPGRADGRAVGHHARARAGAAGTRAGRAGAAGTTGTAGTGARTALRTRHALARGEGVVAGTRPAGSRERPMPWLGANGLLPGRGVAGRGAPGRGAPWPAPPSRAAGATGAAGALGAPERPQPRRREQRPVPGLAGAGAAGAGVGRCRSGRRGRRGARGRRARCRGGRGRCGGSRRRGSRSRRCSRSRRLRGRGRPGGRGLLPRGAWARPRPEPRPWGPRWGTSRCTCARQGVRWSSWRLGRTHPCRSGAQEDLAVTPSSLASCANTDFSHISPVSVRALIARTVVTAGGCSSLSTHRVLISVKPAFGSCSRTVAPAGGALTQSSTAARGRADVPAAQRAPERPATDGEVEAREDRVQPCATPGPSVLGVRQNGRDAVGAGSEDHSQECRPAIRPTTPDAGAHRVAGHGVQSGRSAPVYRLGALGARHRCVEGAGRRTPRCRGGCRSASR